MGGVEGWRDHFFFSKLSFGRLKGQKKKSRPFVFFLNNFEVVTSIFFFSCEALRSYSSSISRVDTVTLFFFLKSSPSVVLPFKKNSLV